MEVFIGGCSQGKLEFVKNRYEIKQEEIVEGANASLEECCTCRILNHFHLFIKKIQNKEEQELEAKRALDIIFERNPDVLLISDEIGSGIVPMDPEERIYREAVGRTLCIAAGKAEAVWRITCGLGQRVK